MPRNKSRAEGKSVTPETAREVWRQGKFGQPLEGERQDRAAAVQAESQDRAAAVQGVQGNLDSEAGRLDGRINNRATISQLDGRIVLLPANDKAPANGPVAYPAGYTLMYGTAANGWPSNGVVETVNRGGSGITFQRQTAASGSGVYQRVGVGDTSWSNFVGPYATEAWTSSNFAGQLNTDNRFDNHLALNGSKAMTGNLNMGGNNIVTVGDAAGDNHAVNRGYMNFHTNFSLSGTTLVSPGSWVNFNHSRGSNPVMIAQAFSGNFWTDGARYSCWAEEIDSSTVRVYNGGGASKNVRIFVRRA